MLKIKDTLSVPETLRKTEYAHSSICWSYIQNGTNKFVSTLRNTMIFQ